MLNLANATKLSTIKSGKTSNQKWFFKICLIWMYALSYKDSEKHCFFVVCEVILIENLRSANCDPQFSPCPNSQRTLSCFFFRPLFTFWIWSKRNPKWAKRIRTWQMMRQNTGSQPGKAIKLLGIVQKWTGLSFFLEFDTGSGTFWMDLHELDSRHLGELNTDCLVAL
jgi:hypothetical protein